MSASRAKPVPIDLTAHRDLLGESREFLRVWASEDGPVTCFINPVPIGADPFAFGMAMVDCVRHAAKAYARAVNISEADALARIWEGLEAERATNTTDATELATTQSEDGVVEFVPKQELH